MLRGAVSILRKKRLRERYMGDLIWKAARGMWTEFTMVPFSEYDDALEGRKLPHELENEKIRQKAMDMLNKFG